MKVHHAKTLIYTEHPTYEKHFYVYRFEKKKKAFHPYKQTYYFTKKWTAGSISTLLLYTNHWPCVSLEWGFGTIGWSWFSWYGFQMAGYVTKSWPMYLIFTLECCEKKFQYVLKLDTWLLIAYCSILFPTLSYPPPTTPIIITCNIMIFT